MGRERLEPGDGFTVTCPSRGGWLYRGACASCPFWVRTDVDSSGHGVVVCRARVMCGAAASKTT